MQTSQTYQAEDPRGRLGNLLIMALLLTVAVLLSIWLFHRIWPTTSPPTKPAAATQAFTACTAISDECGDKATWRAWADVDKSALTDGALNVLDCTHVFKRYDTGAGYNMDGATHTQIAFWFGLSKADRIAFFNACK